MVSVHAGEFGVSPGQACVLYAGEGPGVRVLGGGFIARDAAAAGISGAASAVPLRSPSAVSRAP